jgi:hypothetical protein
MNPKIDHCIELLCHKGCRALWQDIAVLDRGQELPETQELSTAERELLLRELKAIMAVYAGSCDVG